MKRQIDIFTSGREKVGWIEVSDDGEISSNISSSLQDVALTLEQLIKDAIAQGLTVRQSQKKDDKVLEFQKKILSKDPSFVLALRDKINRTKIGNSRVFAVLNMGAGAFVYGGVK